MTDKPVHDATTDLHEANLAFFGAVTASVSHELNNVISIVDQSAGLLGDLVAGVSAGRPLPAEKLNQIAESMQRQTQRGLGIIRRLNKFAHSADRDQPVCDLNETVSNFGKICGRWAEMKRVRLDVLPAPQPVTARANPFLLQHWLYQVVQQFLAVSAPGGPLSISVGQDQEAAVIILRGAGSLDFEETEDRSRNCGYGQHWEVRFAVSAQMKVPKSV